MTEMTVVHSFRSTGLIRSSSLDSGVIEWRHHQGHGKGVWSKPGFIRGSDQVDRVVMCSGGGSSEDVYKGWGHQSRGWGH